MQYRIDDERYTHETVYGVAESAEAVVAEYADLIEDMAQGAMGNPDDDRTLDEMRAEITKSFRDAIVELDETNERVIFDNGGGVTVQLLGWAHYYQDGEQAARDVAEWLKTHDASDWEGHEPEALACDPTYDEIRNGGYTVWTIGDDYPEPGDGCASDEFFAELARLTK